MHALNCKCIQKRVSMEHKIINESDVIRYIWSPLHINFILVAFTTMMILILEVTYVGQTLFYQNKYSTKMQEYRC